MGWVKFLISFILFLWVIKPIEMAKGIQVQFIDLSLNLLAFRCLIPFPYPLLPYLLSNAELRFPKPFFPLIFFYSIHLFQNFISWKPKFQAIYIWKRTHFLSLPAIPHYRSISTLQAMNALEVANISNPYSITVKTKPVSPWELLYSPWDTYGLLSY